MKKQLITCEIKVIFKQVQCDIYEMENRQC